MSDEIWTIERPRLIEHLSSGKVVVQCALCDGTGRMPSDLESLTGTHPCDVCQGKGERVIDPSLIWKQCGVCRGAGKIKPSILPLRRRCPTCGGAGILCREQVVGEKPRSNGEALTSAQKEEFLRFQFRSHIPVVITGRVVGKDGNVILLGGNEVHLTDSLFVLFLRLTVELFKGDTGYVYKGSEDSGGGLVDEGILASTSIESQIKRLRLAIEPSLHGTDCSKFDFVETTKAKHVRLSTHPGCITYDRERLILHDNPQVKALVGQLPGKIGG